ncbi:hypothetical protein D6D21_04556 [Aureobasidium pullulans]|uniref:NACHT domain-containing protein n=1 Tax=Aureobasidium pullulans TaxID=5580 RepID=A0AB74IYP9_AURPU|nr:hypothetical protein D6D21_04556 [Aureobasidium pullulans]
MSQLCGPERAEAYTVAWIAALPHERAAGEAMFDEEYEDSPADFKKSRGDPNAYSWGKIGKHYVVVAALPSGEYGLTSTATVAQGLHSSLPHVRIGLLVGIGAGVREVVDEDDKTVGQRDIRLGDVVVSHPEGTIGGVVQCDLVKAKTVGGSEVLERKGSLNSPPLALRTALTKLQATHIKRGTTIPTIIEEAFERYPNMRSDFCHPGLGGTEIDRRTDTYHSRAGTPISNEARISPKIHYGTVASSNTLEKSARHRDAVLARLAKENIKPMCFEMEAAGLMNNFPCLVIRGTCDYGDEHKNDDWQNYAAITAAGFAKEFLRCVDVQEIQETQEIGNLILQSLGTLHQAVERNREDVSHLKMSADAHRRRHVLDWLCPYDYLTQFENHSARHLRGTGQWFLEDSTFLSWVQADQSSTLICPGGPGCGKTTISALVIDHLRNASSSQKPVIYFFFDYQRRKEQTAHAFVATLLRQLASLSQEVFSAVEKLHNRSISHSRRPSVQDLQSELQSAFQTVTECFVVIDAWDECEPLKRVECANMLRGCLSQCVVHLLATTRDDHEVHALFDGDPTLRIQAHVEDLTLYTAKRAAELAPNIRCDVGLVENVIKGVIDASDGVFLLARLHMNSINDQLTANEVKDTLNGLRKDTGSYSSAYEATMERINQQQKRRSDLGKRILAWVVHAKRPLRFEELNHAIATRPGKRSIESGDMYAKEVILSVCAGLVTLNMDTLRLIHYTAQEFFSDTWIQWLPNETTAIVDTCITYLSFDVFKEGPCRNDDSLKSRLNQYKLLGYAARNWGHHLRDQDSLAETDRTTTETVLSFLEDTPLTLSGSQAMEMTVVESHERLHGAHSGGQGNRTKALIIFHEGMYGVHLAAFFGLEHLTMLLIEKQQDADIRDSHGRTPLWWAANNGFAGLVKTLSGTQSVNLNKGDVKNRSRTCTPLSIAANRGHEDIVQILLNTGHLSISKADDWGGDPLRDAAGNGHEGVIKVLLATKGVDVNSKDLGGRTPLIHAVRYGHERVIKALLAAEGVDVHWRGPLGKTALDMARRGSHAGIIRLLEAAGTSDTSGPTTGGTTNKRKHAKTKKQKTMYE